MNARQKRTLQALRRIHAFVGALPEGQRATIAPQATALAEVIERMSSCAVAQDAGQRLSKAEIDQRNVAARMLRLHHMLPIARMARALLRGASIGETGHRALSMPHVRTELEGLVAAAGAMKEAAQPHAALFTKNGLPADFLDRLERAAHAVRASVAGHAGQRARRAGATAGVKEELTRARAIVNVIDALLIPLLEPDRQRFAEWRSAKRIMGIGAGTVVEEPSQPALVVTPSQPSMPTAATQAA